MTLNRRIPVRNRSLIPSRGVALFVGALLFASTASSIPLANDDHITGVIATQGEQHAYTFSANAGDFAALALVDSSGTLSPHLVVADPNSLVLFDFGHGTGTHWTERLTTTGIYTVTVDAGATQTGVYELRYALAPGANEHGALVNDSRVAIPIALGDLDTFTFDADAGDSVLLTLTDVSDTMTPSLAIFDPLGDRIYYDFHGPGVLASRTLTTSGTHTVLVNAGIGHTGDALLHFVQAPGANEHGLLVDGQTVTAPLDVLGDIDSYAFDANVGDDIVLTLTDASGTLNVNLRVWAPDGSLLFTIGHGTAVSIPFEVTVPGRHVVAVNGNLTQTGVYDLFFSTTGTSAPPVPTGGGLIMLGVMVAAGLRWTREERS